MIKKLLKKKLNTCKKTSAGFRNLLVHEYAKIDPKKVYDNLQKAPDQFKDFIKEILKYIS